MNAEPNASQSRTSTLACAARCGVLALLCVCLLAPAVAQAKQARLFAGSFGAASSTPADPYPLSAAVSVAVDQSTHDFYVADNPNSFTGARVEKFDSTGHFLFMLGERVNKTAIEASRPESEQNVCPAPGHPGDECQGGKNTFLGSTALEEPAHLAVDSSSGPSEGDLYVANDGSEGVPPPGLIEKFDPSGRLIESWGVKGQLNGSAVASPPAAAAGPFGLIGGIAVDPSGNLWVTEPKKGSGRSVTFEFRQDAGLVTDWFAPDLSGAIAVDSEKNVYIQETNGVQKFDSSGTNLGLVSPSKAEIEESKKKGTGSELLITGIALDSASGELYIDRKNGVVLRFDASCQPVFTGETPEPGCTPAEVFGAGLFSSSPGGLAIDSAAAADPLYVADSTDVPVFAFLTVPDVSTGKPTGPAATSAILNGTVDPDGVALTECFFEWGEGSGATYEHKAACEPFAGSIPADSQEHAVKAQIGGLHAGGGYHYRLVAANANDVNGSIDQPEFGGDITFGPPLIESTSALGVTATSTVLQAEVDPNDFDTHVRFEYGTEAGVYTHVTLGQDVGAAGSTEVASVLIQGLVPAGTYHYRAVAENALGEGAQAVLGADRVFTTQGTALSLLPDARQWQLVSPPEKLGALLESYNQEGGLIWAAADGHAITYLANSATEPEPPGFNNEEQVLSTRGSTGWSSQDIGLPDTAATGIAIGQGEEYRFFSEDLSAAAVQPFGQFDPLLSPAASESTAYLRDNITGAYTPLVTGCPAAGPCPAAVEAAADVEPGTVFGETGRCAPHANNPAVAQCGPEFLGGTEDLSHMVLSSRAPLKEGAGREQLYEWAAGKLTQVSVLPNGGLAPPSPSFNPESRHISKDGSSIAWSSGGNLYVRDVSREETVQLDKECQIVENSAEELECALAHLTTVGGESAQVLGAPLGVTRDGSSIYFVATGVLTASPNSAGETAIGGQPNLYLRRGSTTTFITTFSAEDGHDWAGGSEGPARVSPNGEWLAFMAQGSLTGYDNRDRVTGRPAAEVYLYDAAAGRLLCVSCNSTGGRPAAIEAGQAKLVGAEEDWPAQALVAASLPLTYKISLGTAGHQPRYLSDSGRLFFDARDSLVPQDTNGFEDVYQYEPPGVGDCSEAVPAFSPVSEGCVGLISSGTSGSESAFLDASENGNDVFFLTRSKLVVADDDSAFDVYDAHVCSAEVPCLPPPPPAPPACVGDACQNPVAAPNDLTPNSLTFSGPGNLITPLAPPPTKIAKKAVRCKRPKKLSHGKCVKDKKKAKKAKKARKATNERRAKS